MKEDTDTVIEVPDGFDAILFYWDRAFCSSKI